MGCPVGLCCVPDRRVRMPSSSEAAQAERFQPLAGLAAYAIPGSGYLVLGETRRAVAVFIGIALLMTLGLLIGGLDVVDRVEDRWWFLPQAGGGPAVFAVDWLHQRLKADPTSGLVRSVGRVNEVGTLFVVMAGMVNAIAVIDCVWHAPRVRRRGGDRRVGRAVAGS